MMCELNINTTIKYSCKEELNNFKELIKNGMKVNYSEIGRELNIDYRTAKAYSNGYVKTKTRKKASMLDKYYDEIYKLLYENSFKRFYYKDHLYRYLCDTNVFDNIKLSTFKAWFNKQTELVKYFKSSKNNKDNPIMRYETSPGEQAQLDWKEDVKFIDDNGEVHEVNVFSLILGYSRFRYYALTLSKTQDVLFHHLDKAFELFGGVPKTIITDNMKTVMDESRTEYTKGKVNSKFQSFADDYGFKVSPCKAYVPKTKAKVESPMRVLDVISNYNCDFGLNELSIKINQICNTENSKLHSYYGLIPIVSLEKEKGFLSPLPHETIRNPYKISTHTRIVNKDSMIHFKNNMYSVPPKYIYQKVKIDVIDRKLHIYSNTSLITLHDINLSKGNKLYKQNHYTDIVKSNFPWKDDIDIEAIAIENLKKMEKHNNDKTSNINKESRVSEDD